MAQNTESKNLKKGEPENTQQSDQVNGPTSFIGIHAVPGLQYRSQIVFTQCPHCKFNGPTTVESSWNVKNYLFCYYYNCYWKLLQLIRGKDFTLKDGVHSCSSCGKEISRYEAC